MSKKTEEWFTAQSIKCLIKSHGSGKNSVSCLLFTVRALKVNLTLRQLGPQRLRAFIGLFHRGQIEQVQFLEIFQLAQAFDSGVRHVATAGDFQVFESIFHVAQPT